MKAVIARRYGGPEVLAISEVETPKPGPGEVLVKIYASAVTQADVMMRRGVPRFGRLMLGLTRPKASIPGTAFAGKVVAVGQDIARFAVGDDVFGETATGFRAHAQFVAVPQDGIIETIPSNMSYADAAPICDGALTVYNFLTNLVAIEPGQRVLINGASGGLGTAAVQLAKHLGAHVTGVTSTRNLDLVLTQGADRVIDYTREDFTRASERYDVIFDTVGKLRFSGARRVLNPNGVFLSPVLGLGLLFHVIRTARLARKKARFSATGLLPHARLRSALSDLKALYEAGRMWSVVDRRYPLDRIGEAHRYVESGHKRGNVVLEIEHADTLIRAAA